ncbi:ubiquitin-related modifier 1 isoform X1 [Leuresthes tenuis]|uniref:ubiquitin-related modifier 1 isoform X1 n=1 Tax=Leuresthes tenuis TaxID=355514 RepID=UPI003B502F68
MAAPVAIHLEFGGGAELLFNGVKEHQVTLPSQSEPWDMKQLLVWIQRNLLKERPELFVQGDSVANWSINLRTKTTLCLFQLFMEDKKKEEEYKHLLDMYKSPPSSSNSTTTTTSQHQDSPLDADCGGPHSHDCCSSGCLAENEEKGLRR